MNEQSRPTAVDPAELQQRSRTNCAQLFSKRSRRDRQESADISDRCQRATIGRALHVRRSQTWHWNNRCLLYCSFDRWELEIGMLTARSWRQLRHVFNGVFPRDCTGRRVLLIMSSTDVCNRSFTLNVTHTASSYTGMDTQATHNEMTQRILERSAFGDWRPRHITHTHTHTHTHIYIYSLLKAAIAYSLHKVKSLMHPV